MFQAGHIPPLPGQMVSVYIAPPRDASERLLREIVGPPPQWLVGEPCVNGGDHVFTLNTDDTSFRLGHWERKCIDSGDNPPCETRYQFNQPHPQCKNLRVSLQLFKQFHPLLSRLLADLKAADVSLAGLYELVVEREIVLSRMPPDKGQRLKSMLFRIREIVDSMNGRFVPEDPRILAPHPNQNQNAVTGKCSAPYRNTFVDANLGHILGYAPDPDDLVLPDGYRTLHDPDVTVLERLQILDDDRPAGALIRAVVFSQRGKRPNERAYDPAHFLLEVSNPPSLDLTYYNCPADWPARGWHRAHYEVYSPSSRRYESIERVKLGRGRIMVFLEIGVNPKDCLRIKLWEDFVIESANGTIPPPPPPPPPPRASSSRTNAIASSSRTIARPSASSSRTKAVASSSRSTIPDFFGPSSRTNAGASTSAIREIIYVGSSEPDYNFDSDIEIVDANF
ncbi:hypothetical protein C8R43DRAFT_940437 [Mycena crocata]|nr:hypothetical protein C8R43DRAFT_940437 [Mycena crocata]